MGPTRAEGCITGNSRVSCLPETTDEKAVGICKGPVKCDILFHTVQSSHDLARDVYIFINVCHLKYFDAAGVLMFYVIVLHVHKL